MKNLLSISQGPLSEAPVEGLPDARLGQELAALLAQRNGFVAFESALVVRGTGDQPGGLGNWNDPTGWRMAYDDLAEGLFFFAEDVFGGQFALADETVVTFDPETGDTEVVADSIRGWQAYVMDDFEVVTGYPLAHEWQLSHGQLPVGERLMPVKPFVIGGAFAVDNLRQVDDVKSMLLRGGLATKIRDLPDGASIQVSYGDAL